MDEHWLDEGVLGAVRRIAAGAECHLVGGAVRDHCLGRAARDLDLLVARGDEIVHRLAERLPARLVELGGERFAAFRLVGRGDSHGEFVVDVWDRGAASLTDELSRRDFTVNAIAVDLRDGRWHDPLGGRADLAGRILRAVSDGAFLADPLRVLRLARLAAELGGFTIEDRTLRLATRAAETLDEVAVERRREEIVRTLGAPRFDRALKVWSAVGFYPAAFADHAPSPSSAPPSTDPSASPLRRAGRVLRRARTLAGAFAREPIDRLALHASIALAAAGSDVDLLVDSGHLSRTEARRTALVLPHRRLPSKAEEQRWLLHRAAELWPSALLHAAAWDPGIDPVAVERRLADCVARARDEGPALFDPTPLLRGDEIRRLLDLEPGPEIGRLAKRLRRLQVEGVVRERRQAVEWLLSERRSSDADSAP